MMDLQHKPIQERRLFARLGHLISVALALGWYLGHTNFAADYGSAGALILILFWVYYTSLILLLGAHLTHAQTVAGGDPIVPYSYAEKVKLVRDTGVTPVKRSKR